jgi:hypothetical protein
LDYEGRGGEGGTTGAFHGVVKIGSEEFDARTSAAKLASCAALILTNAVSDGRFLDGRLQAVRVICSIQTTTNQPSAIEFRLEP